MKLKNKLFKLLVLFALPIFLTGCVIIKNESPPVPTPNDNITEPDKPSEPTNPTKPENPNPSTKPEDPNPTKPVTPPKDPVTESRVYRLFYYDSDYNIYYIDKKVEIVDNAVIKALSKELQTPPTKNLNRVFYPNVSVKSAKVTDGILKVDLSKNLYTEMNLGSGSEATMLQCLVNTYGYNLKVKKVIITVDGKNYASGHILKEDGEYFTVDYSKAKEIK